MKRKLLLLIIVVSILKISVFEARIGLPVSITSQTQKELPTGIIDITQDLYTYLNNIELFHAYYSYPVFPLSFQQASKLNLYYIQKRKKDYDEIRSIRDSSLEIYPQSNTVYAYDHTFEVTFLSKSLLSILENTYTYTGGAHPNSVTEAHTFSLEDGSELSLIHFFTGSKEEIEKGLKNYIIKEIEKTPDDFFPDAVDTVRKMPLDTFHFYIKKEGIVIFFNPYEISPYARGLVEFKITD